MEPRLLLRNIRHSYRSHEVLRGIDFDLYPGEIHALVGERQAGKSTLVQILSGDLKKQSGQIIVNGREIPFLTPRSSLRSKIGIIYQNKTIIPSLTFVENVYLGVLPFFITPLERLTMAETCKKILKQFNLNINIHVPLAELSESDQQLVELLRLLILDLEIIILDEVSNRRTSAQMTTIFDILNHFRNQGKSIIYITSNIDEIFQLADRVTVIKDGLRKGTERVQDLDPIRLIGMAYSFVLNKGGQDENSQPLALNRFSEELIQSLPTGAILLKADGKVTLANSVAEMMAGETKIGFRGLSLEEVLCALGIAQKDEILEIYNKKLNKTWERLDCERGKIMRLKLYHLGESENFGGTILLVDDISMDLQVKEYLSRADQVASIAELAAGVAHEINNPLAILQNYLILSKVPSSEEERRENLDRMETELERIVEIVESLLSFSRVNQAPKKRTNVVRIIEEVLLLLSHKLSEKSITVRRTWPTEPVVLPLIENKIRQLFINLFVNAYEAVLEGGHILVEVEQGAKTDHVEIRVTDNGYGIAPEIQKQIFNPFFTTKISKTNTGLGLSICQHIVELHGGVMFFESIPGHTTFTLRLPC